MTMTWATKFCFKYMSLLLQDVPMTRITHKAIGVTQLDVIGPSKPLHGTKTPVYLSYRLRMLIQLNSQVNYKKDAASFSQEYCVVVIKSH